MEKNERMIEALGGLIAIPSVSVPGSETAPYGEAVDRALEYMLELCAQLGFRTKNCNHKIGYAEIGEGEELIGILAHLDVVPAGNGWDVPPFALTVTDGKLFGRGVSDDKGPAIASVFAMKDLMDSDAVLNKRIRIIFGLSEEIGDWDDMEFYKQTEEIPAYGFTPDADFPAIYGEKGIAQFSVTLPAEPGLTINGGEAPNVVPDRCTAVLHTQKGELTLTAEGKAAHASTPEDGENAIAKLMAELSQRSDLSSPAVTFFNSCIASDYNGGLLGCGFADEQSGKLTCNVGTVRTDENGIVFTIDIRYPVTYTQEQLQTSINRTLAPFGTCAVLLGHMEPVYADKNGPVISALIEAYRAETGDSVTEPTVIGGGTYARAMPNITAFGPMLPGRELTEHMKNEYLLQEDFILLRRIYFHALKNLLEL